jgi:hypothetical protein
MFVQKLKIATVVMGSIMGLAFPAHAQVDTTKHWYTIFTNASTPAKGAGCSVVKMAFVKAPNMRANALMSPPFGYTKQKVNTYTKVTGSQGGWCPKTMSAFACEKREKGRAKYVWHNSLGTRSCATIFWNGTVLYSK